MVGINWKSDWAKMPRWKKRWMGFWCYLLCAFVSVLNPEAVDMALFKTLSDQFYHKG